jgi:hypothetical protein
VWWWLTAQVACAVSKSSDIFQIITSLRMRVCVVYVDNLVLRVNINAVPADAKTMLSVRISKGFCPEFLDIIEVYRFFGMGKINYKKFKF